MVSEYVPPTGAGLCCACRRAKYSMRNLVALDKLAPTPGTGWGCLVCELPQDGALAIVCDDCLRTGAEIRDVCGAGPLQPARVPVEELPARLFAHHVELHPELWGEDQ